MAESARKISPCLLHVTSGTPFLPERECLLQPGRFHQVHPEKRKNNMKSMQTNIRTNVFHILELYCDSCDTSRDSITGKLQNKDPRIKDQCKGGGQTGRTKRPAHFIAYWGYGLLLATGDRLPTGKVIGLEPKWLRICAYVYMYICIHVYMYVCIPQTKCS